MFTPGIEYYLEKYSDVPRSVILKYEFERLGLKIAQSALDAWQHMDDVYVKGEFMFSWDAGERKKSAEKVPTSYFFKRDNTFFHMRTGETSPYTIEHIDGRFYICEDAKLIEEIGFEKKPTYCNYKTSDGIPMSQIVQPFGDLLFCTINKYCEMWKGGYQCKFCDFMAVTRDQHKTGELGVIHRGAEQIAETLECALWEVKPHVFRHMILSGGSIVSKYEEKSEIDYYCDLLNTIRKRIRNWYGATLQIEPPKDKDGWKKYYDTGIPSIQPNLEVADRELFKIICPGKEKYIGYDEFIRRILEGAEVFGWGRIIPNFVSGVEMVKPWGFKDIDSAVESTLSVFKFLMENGVFPRTAIWLIVPGSALADQDPTPLEYYIKFGRGYKDLRQKYGYGDNLIAMCRACNPQDTLHDWDYAERTLKREQKSGS